MVDTPLERRTLLKAAGTAAGAAAVLGPLALANPAEAAAATAFLHGVASGDPLPDGILLWTRVTPTRDAMPGSGLGPDTEVGWAGRRGQGVQRRRRHGLDQRRPPRPTTPSRRTSAACGPATDYWFRFSAGGTATPRSAAPAPPRRRRRGRGRPALRRGLLRQLGGRLLLPVPPSRRPRRPGRRAAPRRLHLRVRDRRVRGTRGSVVRPHAPTHEILTLADYRIRHATYKTDPDLQALHAARAGHRDLGRPRVRQRRLVGRRREPHPGTEGAWADRVRPPRSRRTSSGCRCGSADRAPPTAGCASASWPTCSCWTCAPSAPSRRGRQRLGRRPGPHDHRPRAAGLAEVGTGRVGRHLAAGRQLGDDLAGSPSAPLPAMLLGPLAELLGLPQEGLAVNTDQWDGYNDDRARTAHPSAGRD